MSDLIKILLFPALPTRCYSRVFVYRMMKEPDPKTSRPDDHVPDNEGPRVDVPAKGGVRQAGPERQQGGIVEGECIVCPNKLNLKSPQLKRVPKRLEIQGLPPLYCCSKACQRVLHGTKTSMGKGLRALRRLRAWHAKKLGTSLRPGDLVELRRDTSPNRLVKAGTGEVVGIRFLKGTVTILRVKNLVHGRTYEVPLTGLSPPANPPPNSALSSKRNRPSVSSDPEELGAVSQGQYGLHFSVS